MSQSRKPAVRPAREVPARPRKPEVVVEDAAAREAWMLIGRIHKAGKAPVWADFELSPSQAQLLWLVEPDRPVAMNELANGLYCDASNVTGLVDRLESRQLIERRADPNDRRLKLIAVTPAGAEFRERVIARMGEPPAAFAGLSPREQATLRDLLRKLSAGMSEGTKHSK